MLNGKDVLVIRSGPEMIFRDLVQAVKSRVNRISMMVQDDFEIKENIPNPILYRIPPGTFDASLNFKGKHEILSSKYDAIIFVTTDRGRIDRLANFFAFTKQIKNTEQYFYRP